ncbi:MAG: hypothetical protein J5630_05350 [Bacteroidaceae bacterium]|nr:hypothetical protein [Bacteroidaceae bacterium]
MKRILLILTMLTVCLGNVWADELPNAVVGTYAFQAGVLTTGADGSNFTKDNNGNVAIAKISGGYSNPGSKNRNWGTVVVRINVPTNPQTGPLCLLSTSASCAQNSQGLYMDGSTLKTVWYATADSPTTRTSSGNPNLSVGEHTIIYSTGNYSGGNSGTSGTNVYVDGTLAFYDQGLCASGINYNTIFIPSAFAEYITEVWFLGYNESSKPTSDQVSSIHTECSNYIYSSSHKSTTDVSNKFLVIDDDANLSTFTNASSIYIATDKTLTLDQDNATISLLGNGTALQSSNITTTVTGDLPSITLKSTAGTLNYNGNSLNGTTLDRVVLNSSTDRIETSGNVTIKNLAGCNLPNNGASNFHYAMVGSSSGTITFYGTCDFTKKSNGEDALSYNLGYGSEANIVIAEGANVKIGIAVNTQDSNNNASITVGNDATLTTIGSIHDDPVIYATNLTNNGTITIANGRHHLNGLSKIHNTLSGSGILNILEGTTLEVSSMPSTMKLTGSGNVSLTSFPSSTAPTLTDWTGIIKFPNGGSSSTNLTTLFNAWGNSNSTIKLNDVQGYLSSNSGEEAAIVNPTLNILSGKTLTLNNGYSDADATISKLTGAGIVDRQKWADNTSQNHNLIITTLKDFTGTLKASGHPIIVTNLVLDESPTNDLLITTAGSQNVTLSNLYIGEQLVNEAYNWSQTTVDNITGIHITESAPAKIAAATSVSPRTIGTDVGEYAVSFNGQSYTNEEDFTIAVNALTTLAAWENIADPSFTINQPTSGYYKLKSKYSADSTTDYYLSCDNVGTDDTNAKQTTTTDEKTIFYIEVGNSNSTIKSYSTGYLFGEYSRANYIASNNNPVKWTFSEGYNKGTYTLTSNAREVYNNNNYSQILYGWSGATDKNSVVQIKADRNGSTTDDGHTDWILIPVAKDELPVIKAPGCTDSNPAILGNITLTSDVTNNITASAKFVDLSDATISAIIDDIKTAVADVSANAIIIAPKGTSVGETTSNILVATDTENTYTCNNLQLNDEVIAQFTSATNFTDTNVTYTRAATTSQWGTIYLPYAPAAEEGVSYYKLTSSEGNTLTFTKVETPVANTPYMYKKTSEGNMTATNESATFALGGDTEGHAGVAVNSYQLVGILTNSSIVANDGIDAKVGYNKIVNPKAYYFKNTDNTFRPLPASNIFSMKAFRCYLTTSTSTSARQNILSFNYEDNDQPTGVSFIESEDGKSVDVIFDLNGRRLQNAKKGINIINGKKVMK